MRQDGNCDRRTLHSELTAASARFKPGQRDGALHRRAGSPGGDHVYNYGVGLPLTDGGWLVSDRLFWGHMVSCAGELGHHDRRRAESELDWSWGERIAVRVVMLWAGWTVLPPMSADPDGPDSSTAYAASWKLGWR
jgi:hypothetical protein